MRKGLLFLFVFVFLCMTGCGIDLKGDKNIIEKIVSNTDVSYGEDEYLPEMKKETEKYQKQIIDYIKAPRNANVIGYYIVDESIFVLDENETAWLLGNRMGNLVENKLVDYCYEAKWILQGESILLITRSGRFSRDFQYTVYAIEDGGTIVIDEGHEFTGEDGGFFYSWNGKRVSKELYEAKRAEYENEEIFVEFMGNDEEKLLSKEDMIGGIE